MTYLQFIWRKVRICSFWICSSWVKLKIDKFLDSPRIINYLRFLIEQIFLSSSISCLHNLVSLLIIENCLICSSLNLELSDLWNLSFYKRWAVSCFCGRASMIDPRSSSFTKHWLIQMPSTSKLIVRISSTVTSLPNKVTISQSGLVPFIFMIILWQKKCEIQINVNWKSSISLILIKSLSG